MKGHLNEVDMVFLQKKVQFCFIAVRVG